MKKNLLLLFFILGIGVHAQTALPPTCEAFLPKVLVKNIVSESEVATINASNNYGQSGTPTRRYWMVFSDRDNNITYTQPNSNSAKFSRLSFNEELRIAKVKGDYALVYSEKKNGAWPEISEKAESRGWVPLSKLLLWQSCPTNEKGIYYKALIVANLDEAKTNDIGRMYRNPDNTTEFQRLKSTMDFFFVMKRDPKRKIVLLSREYTLGGTNTQKLEGWVNVNSYVAWNQRSCLEPNWNPDDVSYFKSNNHKADVFEHPDLNPDELCAHFDFGTPNKHDKNRMTKFRMPNEALRYPILDNDSGDKNIYKCTTFGFNGGNLGNASAVESEKEKKKKEYLNKLENVNLTIVIDGTTSMDKYFPAMKNGIKEAFEYLNKDYKVRVGVVIYRDYPDGDYCTEYLPLQPKADIARVNTFLDKGGDGVYGIKSGAKDHTHEEALYKGIEVALDREKMGFTPDQSNLLLVVGDCGNDAKDTLCLSSDSLVSKLVENNIQMMVFQVRRNNLVPWQLFKQQMLGMLQKNMSRQYKPYGIRAHFEEVEDGRDLKIDPSKAIFVSSMRYPPLQEDMAQNKLSDLIVNSIMDFNQAIRKQISIIDGFVGFESNDAAQTGGESSINASFVKERMGDEYYEMLKKSNTMMAFKGYTKRKDPSGRAYWKPVVFISGDELDQLIKRLTPVYEVSRNGGNDRVPYVRAMKALIKSMIPDITDAEMDQKGTGEVMNLIAGLNETSDALHGPSLLEIQDPKSVNHQQFQSICAEFTKKFRNIQHIKHQRYEYVVRTNNKTYYWIPIEDMP